MFGTINDYMDAISRNNFCCNCALFRGDIYKYSRYTIIESVTNRLVLFQFSKTLIADSVNILYCYFQFWISSVNTIY